MTAREAVLDAAAQVMRDRGLAACTTKEIARAAGYSEATLYKHFADKQDLFLAVLRERLPRLSVVSELVGQQTVAANLEHMVGQLLQFYTASFPIAASIFSQPRLLAGHRDAMHERGAGPRAPVQALITYLQQERTLGRIPATTDVEAVAALLAGAVFQRAFFTNFEGAGEDPDAGPWVSRVVAAAGLAG